MPLHHPKWMNTQQFASWLPPAAISACICMVRDTVTCRLSGPCPWRVEPDIQVIYTCEQSPPRTHSGDPAGHRKQYQRSGCTELIMLAHNLSCASKWLALTHPGHGAPNDRHLHVPPCHQVPHNSPQPRGLAPAAPCHVGKSLWTQEGAQHIRTHAAHACMWSRRTWAHEEAGDWQAVVPVAISLGVPGCVLWSCVSV